MGLDTLLHSAIAWAFCGQRKAMYASCHCCDLAKPFIVCMLELYC